MTRITYKITFALSIWVYTGEKPYKCSHCDKAYVQNCNMAYFEKLISDFKTVWRFEKFMKNWSKMFVSGCWSIFFILHLEKHYIFMLNKYFNENHAKKGEAEQILEIWFQIWNLHKKLGKKHLFPQCIIFIFYLT